MKVLIVTNHCLNSFGGGDLASISYINAFAEISSECHLLYPDKGPILKFLNPKISKIGIKDNYSSFKKLLFIYLGRINLFENIFLQKVVEFNPSIVVFDNSKSSSRCIGKLKNMGKKVITIHHNFEIQYAKASSINLFYRYPFMYYLRKTEKESVLNSDLNLTLTLHDIELLQSSYDYKKTSIFCKIGVFEPEFKFNPYSSLTDESNLSLKFIITGNLEANQTRVCLLPFLKNEFQLIKRNFPESQLIIAGKNPSKQIKEFCLKDFKITLIANPVNITEIVRKADIYICPVSVGGGLKLRILDGLKTGKPILTHEVSARGYEIFEENGFLFTYSNLKSFESSLIKIVTLSKELNKNQIISIYDKEFSFNEGVNRLNKILNDYFILN